MFRLSELTLCIIVTATGMSAQEIQKMNFNGVLNCTHDTYKVQLMRIYDKVGVEEVASKYNDQKITLSLVDLGIVPFVEGMIVRTEDINLSTLHSSLIL